MASVYQPAPGVLQVEMVFTDDAQRVQNNHYVDNGTDTAWTTGAINGVLDVFQTTYWPAIRVLLPTTTSLQSIVATDLTSLTGKKVIRNIDPAEAGTAASPGLPNSVTKAIRYDVGTRGKGQNGRLFLPALTEADVTLNRVAGATLTAWIAALGDMRAAIIALVSGYTLCVLSRYENKAKRAEAVPRPILDFDYPNDYVDVQKDRLPFHKKKRKPKVVTP